MSSLSTREIKSALRKKGFQSSQSHHEMFSLFVEGRQTGVRTRVSHGAREYGDNLLAKVAQQMKISKSELMDFVDCSLGGESYKAILVDKGEIEL